MSTLTSQSTSNSLGLTHEDHAILCRADAKSPALIKMMVGDDRDAVAMRRLARPRTGAFRLAAAHQEERYLQSHHAWVR